MLSPQISGVQEMTAAHQAAAAKLEEAVTDAEKRYTEEKGKCQRMLEAAASGQLPVGEQRQAGEAGTFLTLISAGSRVLRGLYCIPIVQNSSSP